MSTLCGMPYESDQGDGEPCECYREKRVRVRKRHVCIECASKIEPGETAGHSTGVVPSDGFWFSDYRCAACLILAERAATLIGECAHWGELEGYIMDRRGWVLPEDFPTPQEHRKLWEAK